MSGNPELFQRLLKTAEAKIADDASVGAFCPITYGELMRALSGDDRKGKLDRSIIAYKNGTLGRDEMAADFDHVFNAPVVRDFSSKDEKSFAITFNVGQLRLLAQAETIQIRQM